MLERFGLIEQTVPTLPSPLDSRDVTRLRPNETASVDLHYLLRQSTAYGKRYGRLDSSKSCRDRREEGSEGLLLLFPLLGWSRSTPKGPGLDLLVFKVTAEFSMTLLIGNDLKRVSEVQADSNIVVLCFVVGSGQLSATL